MSGFAAGRTDVLVETSATKLTVATLPISPSSNGMTLIKSFWSDFAGRRPSRQRIFEPINSACGIVPTSLQPVGMRSSTMTSEAFVSPLFEISIE